MLLVQTPLCNGLIDSVFITRERKIFRGYFYFNSFMRVRTSGLVCIITNPIPPYFQTMYAFNYMERQKKNNTEHNSHFISDPLIYLILFLLSFLCAFERWYLHIKKRELMFMEYITSEIDANVS